MRVWITVLLLPLLVACASIKKKQEAEAEAKAQSEAQAQRSSYQPSRWEFKTTGGCGDFFLFARTTDDKAMLIFKVDQRTLKLGAEPTIFDLSQKSKTIAAYLEYARPDAENVHFTTCQDLVFDDAAPLTKVAIRSGKITLSVSPDPEPESQTYRVNAKARDLSFESPMGKTIEISDLDFKDISVGWYAG